jgi:hypothetical protein
MIMSSISENPYHFNAVTSLLVSGREICDSESLSVECFRRTYMSRYFEIKRNTRFTLAYRGFGMGERIYVGEELIACTEGWRAWIGLHTPVFDFRLIDGDESIAGRIESRVSYVTGRLHSFSLWLDSCHVYSDS